MLSVTALELFLSVYLKNKALLESAPKRGRAMLDHVGGEQRDECAVG